MTDRVQLIIPDTVVLTVLAREDRLDLLLTFTEHAYLVITDVVEFGSTHKTKLVGAQQVRQFLDKDIDRASIQPTNFGKYRWRQKKGPYLTF